MYDTGDTGAVFDSGATGAVFDSGATGAVFDSGATGAVFNSGDMDAVYNPGDTGADHCSGCLHRSIANAIPLVSPWQQPITIAQNHRPPRHCGSSK